MTRLMPTRRPLVRARLIRCCHLLAWVGEGWALLPRRGCRRGLLATSRRGWRRGWALLHRCGCWRDQPATSWRGWRRVGPSSIGVGAGGAGLNFAASGGTGHLKPPGPLSGDKYSYYLLPQPHCGWKSNGHDPPTWIEETFSDYLLNNKKGAPTVRDPPWPSGKQASGLPIGQALARGKIQLTRWIETQHILPSA